MKDFKEDFDFFLKKLKNEENFTFARFSDGELYMLQGKRVVLANQKTLVGDTSHGCFYTQEDHKEFLPERDGFYRDRLEDSIRYKAPGYFKGISCPCCVGQSDYQWMKKLTGDGPDVTWSNLWMNSNYPRFVTEFIPALSNREVVIVCNENASLGGLPFRVVKDFRVGYNCQINDYGLIEQIKEWIEAEGILDHVFLFSAASLSEFLCHQLHEFEPENTYIDIGTCMNKHFGLSIERGYLKGYWNGSGHPDLFKECVK